MIFLKYIQSYHCPDLIVPRSMNMPYKNSKRMGELTELFNICKNVFGRDRKEENINVNYRHDLGYS